MKCDTSGTGTDENEPTFDLHCGTIYETATNIGHAMRWDMDGLLVERNATESIRGTWSLSPTGAAPTVDIAADDGWHETFLVPGDLSSDSEVAHGDFLRISGMGADFRDVGIYLPGRRHLPARRRASRVGLVHGRGDRPPMRPARAVAGVG